MSEPLTSEVPDLIRRLDALDDETMCFDAAKTYGMITEAKGALEALHQRVEKAEVEAENFRKRAVEWRDQAVTDEIRITALESALRTSRCPHPIIDDETVGACVDGGHCGCDNGLALSATPAPAAPGSPWQPLETAPRDGWVLAWREHSVRPMMVKWDAQYSAWVNDDGHHVYSITHWMPLPPAPATHQDSQQGETK